MLRSLCVRASAYTYGTSGGRLAQGARFAILCRSLLAFLEQSCCSRPRTRHWCIAHSSNRLGASSNRIESLASIQRNLANIHASTVTGGQAAARPNASHIAASALLSNLPWLPGPEIPSINAKAEATRIGRGTKAWSFLIGHSCLRAAPTL